MDCFVIDDLPPEVIAMLMALYSRSPKSVMVHLEQVKKRGPDKFMSTYYVGYNHKSIGDCGTTAMFVERCSLLTAKAVQDTPLYSGQEASTRYLDMMLAGTLNPLPECRAGEMIQNDLMTVYNAALSSLVDSLSLEHPLQPGEDEEKWRKAVKARAFDIARGLLPAGCRTYVAWGANLRQAADHIREMRNHPLAEVREAAAKLTGLLQEKYPSSFGHKIYPEQEAYIAKSMARFAYFDDPTIMQEDFVYRDRLDHQGLMRHMDLLMERPKKTELHHRLRRFGDIEFAFPLDFGSYRDLQRQRSCVQEMPLLTTKYGFHPWYMERLPGWVRTQIYEIELRLEALAVDPILKQYYIPIGYLVPVAMTCNLPSAVYIAELRADETVHQTLRERAQQMGNAIRGCVPGIAMHYDTSPEKWSIKRGGQDIVQKASA